MRKNQHRSELMVINVINLRTLEHQPREMWRRTVLQVTRRYSSKPPAKKNPLGSLSNTGKDEVRPKAYAPPTPPIDLHKRAEEPYEPKEKHDRVSFEYPQSRTPNKPPSNSRRTKRFLPVILLCIGGGWGVFAYKFLTDDTPTEFLSRDKFIPFVITNKIDIDKDHYFLEVMPKFSKWKSDPKQTEYWDGNRLWSVEVKQPQIMVVRRYTPLPLEIYTSEFTGEKLVRIQEEDMATMEGKLVFYIKKYNQGEVARWLSRKPIGSEIELRGPYTEFEFPKTLNNNVERPQMMNLPSKVSADPVFPLKPDNLAFYAAGTGIAPALQLLLTKNPYKGFVDVYYSHKTDEEVPISRLMFFLEKLDRARFTHLVQDHRQKLLPKHVSSPTVSHYVKYLEALDKGETPQINKDLQATFKTALEQAEKTSRVAKLAPSLALVCGPDGYVEYVSGAKPFDKEGQGNIGGLLEKKGWTSANVYKL
ncbi:CYFA0S07e04434g1_1 [Cyberlindnera fabianii]|uniref:CYFA0S07e04434g1_1 n=1 Tax=Cyberlindnera fabianii TaxID=36022 RepID=A0A061AWQ1_CYBFA|nr:CYFA0S07e04434g1_1 [Cyberlindnera fabianii]